MLPGPSFIYQCPICDNLLYRESLRSSNTFGAIYYSDGKQVALMNPEFPEITRCSKCNHLFWICDAKNLGFFERGRGENIKEEWTNADKMRFLTIDQYFGALEIPNHTTKEDELYIRERINWSYNDRIREGKNLFNSKSDKMQWSENIMRLIELLDESILDEKIMIAELNRTLGNFEKCMELLASIENPEYEVIFKAFKKECTEQNSNVFRLNYD